MWVRPCSICLRLISLNTESSRFIHIIPRDWLPIFSVDVSCVCQLLLKFTYLFLFNGILLYIYMCMYIYYIFVLIHSLVEACWNLFHSLTLVSCDGIKKKAHIFCQQAKYISLSCISCSGNGVVLYSGYIFNVSMEPWIVFCSTFTSLHFYPNTKASLFWTHLPTHLFFS